MDKQKLIRIFDKQATDYARKREDPKQQRWRRNLIGHAEGDVLELAVGAGANFLTIPGRSRLLQRISVVQCLRKHGRQHSITT